MRSLAQHSAEYHNGANSKSWLKKADEAQDRVDLVPKALTHHELVVIRKGELLKILWSQSRTME